MLIVGAIIVLVLGMAYASAYGDYNVFLPRAQAEDARPTGKPPSTGIVFPAGSTGRLGTRIGESNMGMTYGGYGYNAMTNDFGYQPPTIGIMP